MGKRLEGGSTRSRSNRLSSFVWCSSVHDIYPLTPSELAYGKQSILGTLVRSSAPLRMPTSFFHTPTSVHSVWTVIAVLLLLEHLVSSEDGVMAVGA